MPQKAEIDFSPPLIGVLRKVPSRIIQQVVEAAIKGGLKVFEITVDHPDALKQISLIKNEFSADCTLGAGTVLSIDDAKSALEAGAEFIVSPALIPSVIKFGKCHQVPVFSGAFTPTEVFSAQQAGADMVKIFPASILGPGFIKNLKGPFPEIKLMPTGGISVEQIGEYFQAGASVVGVGSELFQKTWLNESNFKAIEEMTRKYLQAISVAK